VENEQGIIRYSNKLGNIIIDLNTTYHPPHYVNRGIDLRNVTNFKQADKDKVKRIPLNHFSMVEGVVRKFESIKWQINETKK